jgi:hypothetical protein
MIARDAGKLVPAMIETLSPGDFPWNFISCRAFNFRTGVTQGPPAWSGWSPRYRRGWDKV